MPDDTFPHAVEWRRVPIPPGQVDPGTTTPPPAEPASEQPPTGWSPEVIESLATSILPYVDRYLKLQENAQKHEVAITESDAKWKNRTTLALLGFALLTIVAMSWLTYVGSVSGDALLFLVGTTVGALFTMLQHQLRDRRVAVVSDDE